MFFDSFFFFIFFVFFCLFFFFIFCFFFFFIFFFQAEDGIRDLTVTGVQTCALPISRSWSRTGAARKTSRPRSAPTGSSTRTSRTWSPPAATTTPASPPSTPPASRANTSPATSPGNSSRASRASAPTARAPSASWTCPADAPRARFEGDAPLQRNAASPTRIRFAEGVRPLRKVTVPIEDRPRALLLELFRAGVAAVNGRRRVRAALASDAGAGLVSAFAVGKAAASMMQGARDALGARLARGLVVAPDGAITAELRRLAGMQCIEAGHPRPDARSLAAGEALIAFAAATPPGSRVLLLVSGGASALLEVPAPGVGLAELTALFDQSLAERLDIETLNRRRAALSRIKGGRLPALFRQAST